MKTHEIVSYKEVCKAYGNADFGKETPRRVVNKAVLKVACGFSNGSTATDIIKKLGLISAYSTLRLATLTEKGRKYLWSVYKESYS